MNRRGKNPSTRQPDPSPKASTQLVSRASRSGRESVESFVVVILGFLVWNLEAEGFVIPTGSMAPTLMGRHKVVTCPQCAYTYTVNADREVESTGPATGSLPRVRSGTCVNCRFEASLEDSPSVSGDRIYVMKSGISLPFSPSGSRVHLNRWDVGVFKLPENPEVRYIKRTVGMPGEVLRIQSGDLWVRPLDDLPAPFERLRRPLEHQQAMQMMVHDDSHRPGAFAEDPRWRRWVSPISGGWAESSPGNYRSSSEIGDWSELRYRHVIPEPDQWHAVVEGSELPRPPRASLITDFYSYNTDVTAVDGPNHSRPWFQPNWVGDLTLSARVKIARHSGSLRFDLIKSGVAASCEIDLANGESRLMHGSVPLGEPAPTAIAQGSDHEIVLANVDDRLTLCIDGSYPFGEGRTYEGRPESMAPTVEDLEPVRIATRGAEVELSGLVLMRDIHYTLEPGVDKADEEVMAEQRRQGLGPASFFDLLSDPSRFAELERRGLRDYPISRGCYMMLGDNSPWSRDGRAWGRDDQMTSERPDVGWDQSGRANWEVPDRLVVGKAFCVYWPGVTPVWPRLRFGADLVLPFRPSAEKIRWIR